MTARGARVQPQMRVQDTIKIGTRGSALALAQAREVCTRLVAAHGLSEMACEIRVVRTSGDRIQDRPLAAAGGKGLFTKEIDEALLAGTIDLGVHSMKDMESALPAGLAIGAVLPRADVRDAFISLRYRSLAELPVRARVGTSSLRRQAQAKRLRPDIEVVGLRGNVETRLKKLELGVADATFLAVAGLHRLGLGHRITALMTTDEMLPAVAQGAIAVVLRANDQHARRLAAPLNDGQTALCVGAERAFLARLDGSCRTPIAGLAELAGDRLRFRGMILSPDGSQCAATERNGAPFEAESLGVTAAEELLVAAGPSLLGEHD